MKLFLFSASVFYLLGLKLTSKIELKPVFYHKAVSTETPATPDEKVSAPALPVKMEQLKKDTTIQTEPKSNQQTAPVSKTIEK
jgi:hypothetical protein